MTPRISGPHDQGYFLTGTDAKELAKALADYLNGVRGGLTVSTIHNFLRKLKDLP